ncbi:MAG: flagellar biosynthesis anti-sigma factor FlgM [Gammaproteobacteria bacterium]
MNEIRFDKAIPLVDSTKIQLDRNKSSQSTASSDITISNQLGSLINSAALSDDIISENEHVKAMKNRIESGNYQIDSDKLAKALTHHVFGKLL